ncbi:hypothetical protein FHG87_007076 [Trinorchestia longiramus]|nr:hypothetical protein FHG87_007076 [Trinorchestia longiramus]
MFSGCHSRFDYHLVNSEDLCPCESFLLVNTEFEVSRLSSSPEAKMKVFILVLSLASVASARWSLLGQCDSQGSYTAPSVLAQEVNPFNVSIMSLIAMDLKFEHQHLHCQQLEIIEGDIIKLILSGRDSDGKVIKYASKVTPHPYYKYMSITRLDEGSMPDDASHFPPGVFNVNWNGETRMYYSYFSPYEMVLRTCLGGILGSNHNLYVFSTQPNFITKQDPECLADTVRALKEVGSFQINVMPHEDAMACHF